ncbi:MAG: GntR family transcriptional regulator [Pseudoruegeria sp.]
MQQLKNQSLEPTVVSETVSDQLFRRIYHAIITLELAPGAKISETEVARQFSVSRQPVREAFATLGRLGFLSIRPQRATLVTKISDRAVKDASFVRCALELACFKEAMGNLTSANLDQLRDNLSKQSVALEKVDLGAFQFADDQFHELICTIAGHGPVWKIVQGQKAHLDRARFLSMTHDRQVAYDEHLAILQAMEDGAVAKLEEIVTTHLTRLYRVLPRIRAAHGYYFEDEA